jgi:hypothetical protein
MHEFIILASKRRLKEEVKCKALDKIQIAKLSQIAATVPVRMILTAIYRL